MVTSTPRSLCYVPLLLNHIQIMEAQAILHPTTVKNQKKKEEQGSNRDFTQSANPSVTINQPEY